MFLLWLLCIVRDWKQDIAVAQQSRNWESVHLRATLRHTKRDDNVASSQCTNCANCKVQFNTNGKKQQLMGSMPNQKWIWISINNFFPPPTSQMRKVKEKSIKRATTSSAASRQMKKSMAIIRPVIELPTTEPDFDCYGTVSELDDERDFDEATRHNTSTAAKIARTPHRQLQLNLVEQKMPPELTVTGAQHQQHQQKSNDDAVAVTEIIRCSDKSLVSELPSIGHTRRHFSWHNIKKCVR